MPHYRPPTQTEIEYADMRAQLQQAQRTVNWLKHQQRLREPMTPLQFAQAITGRPITGPSDAAAPSLRPRSVVEVTDAESFAKAILK